MTAGASAPVCPWCGSERAPDARYCAHCGGTLLGAPEEAATDDVALSYATAERRVFGVAPPGLLAALTAFALVASLLLFGFGKWVLGILCLAVAVALGLVFAGAVRQLPDDAVARAASAGAERTRGLVGFVRVTVASWTRACGAVVRLWAERRRLRREQAARIRGLGEAAYRQDETAVAALRAEAQVLGERIDRCGAEMQLAIAAAGERVMRERMTIQPTRVFAGGGDEAPAAGETGDER